MSPAIWLPPVVAGLVALVAPLLTRPLLRRFRVVDLPNKRSSHSVPTLRGGGLGQLVAVAAGFATASGFHPADLGVLGTIMASAVAIGIVGLIEDVRGLPLSMRAGLQVVIGALLGGALVARFSAAWYLVPLAILVFAAYVNFANFMDGINGISGIHGLVVCTSYTFIGFASHAGWLMVAGSIVALAYLAFLPWNFSPPGLFLGDVGSYLLGGAIAGMAIAGTLASLSPLAFIGPVLPFGVDASVTLIRRIIAGKSWTEPHREHIYQQLVDGGWSHVRVALIVGGFSVLGALLGILAMSHPEPVFQLIVISLMIMLSGFYLALPRIVPFQLRANGEIL